MQCIKRFEDLSKNNLVKMEKKITYIIYAMCTKFFGDFLQFSLNRDSLT